MSALSDIVAKFRSGSPNIARAFDEVERRLVLLEAPAPPPPPPPPPPPTGRTPIEGPRGTLTKRTGSVFLRSLGAPIEGIHVTSSTDGWGLAFMQWPPAEWAGTQILRDCRVDNVVTPPFDMGGTDEADYWLAQKCLVQRIIATNAEWMSAFTGSRFSDSLVEHFQFLLQQWVGLYIEHVSCLSTFRIFKIESGKNGINVEWWYPNSVHAPFAQAKLGKPTNGRAGSFGNKIYDGSIKVGAGSACIYLDAGSCGFEIAKDGYLSLDGPTGIVLPRNTAAGLMDPDRPNIVHAENINWNSIPENRRIVYHDDPIGVAVTPRFAFGLRKTRLEHTEARGVAGVLPQRRHRDWDALAKRLEFA